jgi:protein SCO1/2
MNKQTNILLILAGIVVLSIGIYFSFIRKPAKTLPYFGEKTIGAKGDSLIHSVMDFSLINQEGKTITQKDLQGKIYVADYFFANCKSICPKMSTQLERVQQRFKNQSDFMILSHSVDPLRDSVAALAKYAQLHGADSKKWYFLTGDKKQLYDLARHSYLVVATQGDGGADDFVHTEQFALIDKEKHIRGFYDGTDSLAVNRLMVDIDQLILSYK